ncbi:MAG: hypothetical protein QM779_07000 [Propionicimonas sp.]|uniref:hypothetical protein n=1 Tax=Propionicimonas sp. TaxID=1955623 RepID=UPI003D137D03
MSDQEPNRFENYPAQTPEPSGTTDGQPAAGTGTPYHITPYHPPSVSAPSTASGTGRRNLLGLVIGVPVALGVIGWLGRASDSQGYDPYPEYPGGFATEDDTGSETDEETPALAVGPWAADVPDGWDLTSLSTDEAVSSHGANWVQAYAFTADEDDRASDLITALVRRRKATFEGDLSDPVSSMADGVQHATVSATGTVSGKKARLKGHLWIDLDAEALLVVRVLTAKSGSTTAEEAQAMVDQLAGEF